MLDSKKADLFKQSQAGSVEYLKEHPYLMADTALFDAAFKQALLAAVENLDESLDGLLIHGENFQALNLLQERYRGQVKCVYIDPPYNTSASEIIYKNSFKHSSWLSLMDNRISIGKSLMDAEDGFLCCTIDDVEQKVLSQLLENNFGDVAGTVAIRIKPSGRPIPNGFALSHEYAIFARMTPNNAIQRLDHSEEQAARYKEVDTKGTFFWELFRKAGSNSNRSNRPSMFYPFYLDTVSSVLRLPSGTYDSSSEKFQLIEMPKPNEIEIYPIKDDGSDGCWYFGYERAIQHEEEFKAERNSDGNYRIYYRRRPNAGVQPTTNWFDSKYSATEHGTALLKALFGEQEVFSYPKSIHAVQDCLTVMGAGSDEKAHVLDYFGGSGTTGHAVINLNRKDGGKRKYLLVEQGDYFEEVTKPRIQKIVYSADWKDGKATAPQTGISHAFKVLKLESYEDTLNNLQLRRSEAQQDLLDTLPPSAQEDYLLSYLLDIESRGSLLSVEHFNKPFDCKLKVAVDSAGAYEERTIDLVETFNYLIGLRVKHIDMQRDQGFVWVSGWLPTGEKTLVLWRDVEQVDYEKLNRLCEQLALNPADSEFDLVYINGDHNIPTAFTTTEAEGGITKTLKIRQIEPEFLSRMFAVEGV
jgi:adenine-specific DNA-methyltransferase